MGLIPMIAETSIQAQFLMPMALSIAFGILFSSLLILLLVPACLAIGAPGQQARHNRVPGFEIASSQEYSRETDCSGAKDELAALEAVLASSVSLSLMAAPFGTRQT